MKISYKNLNLNLVHAFCRTLGEHHCVLPKSENSIANSRSNWCNPAPIRPPLTSLARGRARERSIGRALRQRQGAELLWPCRYSLSFSRVPSRSPRPPFAPTGVRRSPGAKPAPQQAKAPRAALSLPCPAPSTPSRPWTVQPHAPGPPCVFPPRLDTAAPLRPPSDHQDMPSLP